MSDAIATIDAFIGWLRGTPYRAYADAIQFLPVDAKAYADVFAHCGFPLPASLRGMVEQRGLLCLPPLRGPFGDLPRETLGFSLEPPDRVFANVRHMEAAIAHGVAEHEHWLVFATIAGDLDGAWTLDDRFVADGDGASGEHSNEYAIGYYHQDEVYHREPGPAGKVVELPHTQPSFQRWLAWLFQQARAGFERAEEQPLLEAIGQLRPPPDWNASTSQRVPAREWDALHDSRLGWGRGSAIAWRIALQRSKDPQVVRRILAEIDKDLAGHPDRETIPGLSAVKEGRTAWPHDYPGPRDLLVRLSPEGRWGRRDVARWALEHTGHPARRKDLERADALLAEVCAGHGAAQDGLQCATELALVARRDPSLSPLERNHAWALVWALGHPEPARIDEAILRAMQVARLATPDGRAPLEPVAVYQKLAAIVRGEPDFIPRALRPSAPAPSAVVAEFEAFLGDFAGTQRELLGAFEAQWLDRLLTLDLAGRAQAAAMMRRRVKSKKLASERDAIVDRLL